MESIIEDAKGNTWCVDYGIDKFCKLFNSRQISALFTLAKHTRSICQLMQERSYSVEWRQAIVAYLACGISRLLDFANCNTQWKLDATTINHSFVRFVLPVSWDYAEGNILGTAAGSYLICYERICTALDTYSHWSLVSPKPQIEKLSAIQTKHNDIDIIITDPPYYNALGYSVVMDFFYVWLRRTLYGLFPDIDEVFEDALSPKWNHENNDGELVDDAARFGGDKAKSKANYEDGMFRVFQSCYKTLKPEGRLVIVFAHKEPDAWETLVSAIIRAGFIVDGSWPIQTEQTSRMRAISSAALSSSVWLVCKKRPATARPGWDNRVLEEMRQNITTQLREFWDAGIRGPDFVWAATGPAMEAYSKYPVVKKASEPGKLLSVSEFLNQVRRLVLDFVVGRVLSETTGGENVSDLDEITTYYLLHRHDFGMEDAPVGACILYAVSCGLSDNALADQFDILMRTGGKSKAEENDDEEETTEDADTKPEEGTGSKVKLKPWQQRKRKTMGLEAAGGRPVPLIDQVHRLMHLWKAGDVVKVDEFLDDKGLRRNALFHQLLQALIEMAEASSDERALLESISNHIAARSGTDQLALRFNDN